MNERRNVKKEETQGERQRGTASEQKKVLAGGVGSAGSIGEGGLS